MPNNGDNENKERRIRDMLGLVKFCLENTKSEDAPDTTRSFEAMDPDRRAWLQSAMESMTVDTTKQLLENLATVKETIVQLEKDPTHNVPVQRTCDAMSILTDLCEEIDYAADFAKLDGFSIFKPLIACPHEEMIVKACELIAALAQNNPLCQNMAMQTRLLERLLDFIAIQENQSHTKARSYALYAVSSIVRHNTEVRTHFETHLDGLTVLLNILCHQNSDNLPENKPRTASTSEESKKTSGHWWRKLKIRSVFLFGTLCAESEKSSDFFFQKQAIVHIASQLSTTHDPEFREHLLIALNAFLMSLSMPKQVESIKLSPELEDILKRIYKESLKQSSEEDYDMTNTRSTCKDLLHLIEMALKG